MTLRRSLVGRIKAVAGFGWSSTDRHGDRAGQAAPGLGRGNGPGRAPVGVRLACESLERRRMLSVSAVLTGSVLQIDVDSSITAYVQLEGGTIEVADDSAYTSTQSFKAASVSSVTVTGDSGKDLLDVTAGIIAASLSTSLIESVSFGSGAAFSGKVSVGLASGDLTVTGITSTGSSIAVTASTGNLSVTGPLSAGTDVTLTSSSGTVAITAAIVASGSVKITGPAGITTAGTVDAGEVTYNSPVTMTGPVTVSTAAGVPYIIPIYHINANGTDHFAIYASLDGGPLEPYELDTGSPNMVASYGSWWPDSTPPTAATLGGRLTQTFADGTGYTYDMVNTPVALGDSSGDVLTPSVPANLGQIITVDGDSALNTYQNWVKGVATNGTALNDGTYGIFGAGLNGSSTLATILAQLPLGPGLDPGFVIRSGGSDASVGELIVGLTPAMISMFNTTMQMEPSNVDLPNAYGQIVPGYNAAQVTTTSLQLSQAGTPTYTAALSTEFDTGGGDTNVIYQDQGTDAVPGAFIEQQATSGAVEPGVEFAILDSSNHTVYSLHTGVKSAVNQTEVKEMNPAGLESAELDPGIALFYTDDVMFDLQNGELGLTPSQPVDYGSPETQTTGDIVFASTVNGPGSLVLCAPGGSISMAGVAGGSVPLAGLTTSGASTTLSSVTTTGAQIYQQNVVLDGTYTTGGTFSVGGTTTIAGPVMINATSNGGSGEILFSGTVDGTTSGSANLSLSAGSGPITLSAEVGGLSPLGSLTIASAGSVVADGTIQLDGASAGAGPDGLTLGAGVDSVDFQVPGSMIQHFVVNGVLFEGGATRTTISGFTILSNVYDGIQLSNGDDSGTTISGNTIEGNTGFGIETVGVVTNLTIADNTVGALSEPNTHGIVLAPGNDTGTTISGNTIQHNTLNGVVTSGPVTSLSLSGNTIQDNGADGVQLAAGDDTATAISGNTIIGNYAYGIQLTGGVTGLVIGGNTIGAAGSPNANGIGVAGGDFSGTTIVGNTIQDNSFNGVVMGIGVPSAAPAGNPLYGYPDYSEHYVLPYANTPDFGSADPEVPEIKLIIDGTTLPISLDTGSRGLFVSADKLPPNIPLDGPPGYVYLNSSDRMYKGTWSNETVTFPTANYYVNGTEEPGPPARANMLVLVVTALGASSTPSPGNSVAQATFQAMKLSGNVTITNGTTTTTAKITDGGFTIPGGYWATYAANANTLPSVSNLGVGFDRTGQGAYPNDDLDNQQYNAFLNISQMQSGSMVAGFILTRTGVQLGLDNTVAGYAYTNLTPTGLSQVAGSPPDWQAPTGTVSYQGESSGTGELVIDTGITYGILTLPGYSPESQFSGSLGVNLINSNGAVGYQINSATHSIVNPQGLGSSSVQFFNPLSGNFSENLPPASGQFFNTGLDALNAFNYLYDADGGYIGLLPNTSNPPAGADVAFTAAYYPNPLTQPAAPGPVTNLTVGGAGAQSNTIQDNGSNGVQLDAVAFTGTIIASNLIRGNTEDGVNIAGSGATVGGLGGSSGNTITGNSGNGVVVEGSMAVGNVILSNSIFLNAGIGIALTEDGNGPQPAPVLSSIKAQAGSAAGGSPALATVTITGTMPVDPGYGGPFDVQFFDNPASDGAGGGFEGRTLIGSIQVVAGSFTATFSGRSVSLGNWITATATMAVGDENSSAFSSALHVMTLAVSTNADSGPGSLRYAIKQANAAPGLVYIDFDLPGADTTINLASALPTLTEPVVIDGRSQAGYVGSPLVTIRGTRVPGNANGITIGPRAAGTEVIGLAIDDFMRGSGIQASAADVILQGDSLANDWVGLSLVSATGGRVIGNTITDSRHWGIDASGNLAGTEVQGNLIQGTRNVGVMLHRARGITFGGTSPGADNVITKGTRWRRRKIAQTGLIARGNSTGTLVQAKTITVDIGRHESRRRISSIHRAAHRDVQSRRRQQMVDGSLV
jgi:Right handed beta helix region